MIADADLDLKREMRLLPPATPRTHLELARTFLLPDGPSMGDLWDPDTEPLQHVWVRQLDNPRWRKRTLVAPSQRGKSLMAIVLPLIYVLVELVQSVAYIMPTLDKLNQNWIGKLKPLIKGCGYGAWLPEKGPGSRGGKPAAITLMNPATRSRAGTLYFMAAGGGGKETSLASNTTYLSAADEGDDFESEGHLKLGEKRTESFGDEGSNIVASTVNERKGRIGHPALAHYMLGTKTRLWFQCPTCAGKGPTAGFQVLKWENVRYDAASVHTARATARYACEHCGAAWDDAERKNALLNFREVHHGQTVNAAGVVVGPEPLGDHYSLISEDLEYNLSVLGKIAEEHWAATEAVQQRNDHSLMRLFFYKRLCRDYAADLFQDGEAEQIDPQYLYRRSAASDWGPSVHSTDRDDDAGERTYSRHIAPMPNAEMATVAVDVQANRCYWYMMAADTSGRTWDVAWAYEHATCDRKDMTDQELWAVLDRIDAITRNIAEKTPIVKRGVDANFKTEAVLAWLRTHHEWHPVYGASSDKASRMHGKHGARVKDFTGIVYLRRDESWTLKQDRVHIDTIPMRMAAQRAYLLKAGSPGAAHLPNGLKNNQSDKTFLQHLCAEQWVESKMRWEKSKGGGRHDLLDTRVYAYALYRWHLEDLRRNPPQAESPPVESRNTDDWDSAMPNW